MQKLLTPDFRHSLLGEERTEIKAQPAPPSHHEVNALLTAQWAIITRTLERVLEPTGLYDTVVQELARALQQIATNAVPPAAAEEEEFPLPGLVYRSPAMHDLARQIYKTRESRLPALITGEPGTGKEGIARALHLLSARSAKPFVAFNCTIVTRELMSSQLFGHRKGSFTGADKNNPGSIRSAEGGTIFLDEIGDLPLELQPKLLRFLQDGEVHPVGESKPVKVDVRVINATNRDLEAMVAQGLFREDLYYRINILRFHMPPLRDRREEIPMLALHLLDRFAQEAHKRPLAFAPEALARLVKADWPGNIRQLANQIQRAVALVDEEELIQPHHLWAEAATEGRRLGKRDWLDEILQSLPTSAQPEPPPRTRPRKPAATRQTLAQEVDALEREIILETLEQSNSSIKQTAKELGLTRRGLRLKMGRLGIDPQTLRTAKAQDAEPA
jgi:DNA-binding NtrC family response regulator